MRTDDAERADAREALGRHFSAGRLDYTEYEDRIGVAMSARTRADLWELFTDLPHPHPRSLSADGGPDQPTVWRPDTPLAASRWVPPPQPPANVSLYAGNPPTPFGFDPQTGRPYSDKEKVLAGLLQLFVGCFGVGQFYTGHTGIGVAQLLITVLTLGFLAPVSMLWGLIDGILMLTGSVADKQGRPLR